MCLVYPNLYGVGMANLGFQTAYRLLNSIDEVVCERSFLPDEHSLAEHLRTSTPLLSYESQRPVKEFDVVAFSLPFEQDYPNIPLLLGLSGIPASSKDRDFTKEGPLVVAGGVGVSLNPEPVSGLVDLCLIGEGEGLLEPFVRALVSLPKGISREDALLSLSASPGVYAPSLYEFVYDGQIIKEIRAHNGAPSRVKAVKNLDLSRAVVPETIISTPDTEFKDTHLLEVERGCPRLCRFCAAGFIYLPPRWRDKEGVLDSIRRGVGSIGKVGLIGTAVSEYPWIKDALRQAIAHNGSATLSSVRADVLDDEMLALLKESGLKTLTVAPEAGSDRLRRVLNKDIATEVFIETAQKAQEAGISKLKLYFLAGLPTESDEDVEAIAELVAKMRKVFKGGSIALSVNAFIPKPHTPFQWCAFENIGVIEHRYAILKKSLRPIGNVTLKSMPIKEALFQAYLSRSDRRAFDFLTLASEKGFGRSVKEHREFIDESVHRQRAMDEILPWDVIDHGINKGFLQREYKLSLEGKATLPCDVGVCRRCGVC